MKVVGYYALVVTVGVAGKPKSDNNPIKRIETLGDNLIGWTDQHLCFEGRCLKAVTKTEGNWTSRISKVVSRMKDLYNKCGNIPDRGSRKRRQAETDPDPEMGSSKWVETDMDELIDEENDIENGVDFDNAFEFDAQLDADLISSRYNRDDPVKGVGQLTTAVRKWAHDYLSQCQSRKKAENNGVPMISLRMLKWKVILENGFHKIRKANDEIKPTPGSWAKWYDRKVQKAG